MRHSNLIIQASTGGVSSMSIAEALRATGLPRHGDGLAERRFR